MEKLIALLNEYDGGELEYTIINNEVKRRVKNMIDPDKPYKWCSVWRYSKSFWFIKWLVDNDKITFDENEYKKSIEKLNGDCRPFEEYELLLMVLSIEDDPIEFLISILK